MNPVLGISRFGDGVQIIPDVKVPLSVAEALERHLHKVAWVDFNPAHARISIRPNSNDPDLQKEALNLTASFFRGRERCSE